MGFERHFEISNLKWAFLSNDKTVISDLAVKYTAKLGKGELMSPFLDKGVRKVRHTLRQLVAWYYNTFHSTPRPYQVSFNPITGPYQLVMRLSDGSGMRRLRREGFEMDVRGVFLPFIRPGWVCCDIGAQAGDYMVEMALLVGSSGCVFAYEPIPHYAELIDSTLRANHLTNVSFKAAAVGLEPGTISVPRTMLTGSLLKPGRIANGGSAAPMAQVPIVRLDDEIPHLDAIKIDVEGFEVHVLNGMKRLIDSNPALIMLLEVHNKQLPIAGSSLAELAALLLQNHHFFIYQVSEKHCLCSKAALPVNRFRPIDQIEQFVEVFQKT
jgi:FkbM family methyltransferase